MALITVCDLCEKPKEFNPTANEGRDYCPKCAGAIASHRSEAAEETRKKYDSIAANQGPVLALLEYLADEKPEEFRRNYGTKGREMLDEAIGKNT